MTKLEEAASRVSSFLAQFLVDHPGPEVVTVVGYHSQWRVDLNVVDLRLVIDAAKRCAELEKLADAATDVCACIGGQPDPTHALDRELAGLLGKLYLANDAWQEWQVSEYAETRPSKRKRRKG